MKTPSDGWDADEGEVLEASGLRRELEAVRARHALSEVDEARLLARIRREAGTTSARTQQPMGLSRWVPLLAAASIVLVTGAVVLLRRGDDARPSVKAPEPTVASAAPPSPSPVFYLSLDKPAIKISPAALAYRGPGGENPLLADLKP